MLVDVVPEVADLCPCHRASTDALERLREKIASGRVHDGLGGERSQPAQMVEYGWGATRPASSGRLTMRSDLFDDATALSR
jgi:hypothetical protein